MSKTFTFQDPGEGIHEAEVLKVLVSKGDEVREGQDVLQVETDKANFEVSSPFFGVVQDVAVKKGDVIHVGDALMRIGEPSAVAGETRPETEGEKTQTGVRTPSQEGRAGAKEGRQQPEGKTQHGTTGKEEATRDEEEPEPEEEEAEGQGEARKEEREETGEGKTADAKEKPKAEAQARTGEAPRKREEKSQGKRTDEPEADQQAAGPVPASPATRRIARELQVDLREVTPSGENGRVLVGDVRAFAEARGDGGRKARRKPGEQQESRALRPAAAPALPDFSQWGPVERQPLRSIRRSTARRMAVSWAQVPHVTHNDVADITELEEFRRRHEAEVLARGGKLTLTVLVMKAVVAALREYPRFNASLDTVSEEIIVKQYYHLGVALDSERGLLVPVIRDVDRKSIGDLAVELFQLAERVRGGEVRREELSGGTFTITNVGPLGGTGFTPIINYPEVAILGLARARLHPVVRGSLQDAQMVPRLLLPISFAFDHRVNDGAEAARFVKKLIDTLTNVEAFALAV